MTTPRLLSFSLRDGAESASAPADGAHRLLIRRALYDRGSLVEASPSFAPLIGAEAVFAPTSTLAALGIEAGGEVRISSTSGVLVLPVEVDDTLPARVVAITANLSAPGAPGASALVDSSEAAIDVALEKV